MARLRDKVALVTGAARGTRAVTARRFVAEGARVILADILDDLGEAVSKDVGEDAHHVHLDVTHEDDWRDAISRTHAAFGRLDVLVNNAAVLEVEALEDTTLDAFVRAVMVDQVGSFLGIRAATAVMKD